MNRLIDAEELINERPENLNPNMDDEIKSAYNKGWNACNSEWFSLIKEQPTAYDVEKMVKIFEEKARNCQNNDKYYGEKAEWMSKAYRDAIEVVKGGTK